MADLPLRFNKDMLVVAPLLTMQLLDSELEGDESLEHLTILDEALVEETYLRFKFAGAQCALTNTLKANRLALRERGLEDAFEEINRLGVKLVRKAGFEHCLAVVELTDAQAAEEQACYLAAEDPDALMLVGAKNEEVLSSVLDALCTKTDTALIVQLNEGLLGKIQPNVLKKADVMALDYSSTAESLLALEELARCSPQPLMVSLTPAVAPASTKVQQAQALERAADELADKALEARALGAQFIGSKPGSSPVFTGALYAAIGGLDVLQRASD